MILKNYQILLSGALCAWAMCGGIVFGQAQPPAIPLSKEAKENAELIETWSDLGTLRVLTPLKLTNEQIDKLIVLITTAEAAHNQKLVAMSNVSLKKLAADIRAAKKKALKGEDVSAEMSERLTKGMEEHLGNVGQKKQEAAIMSTLAAFAPKIRALLTTQQIAAAAKIAQEEQEKIAKGNKGTTSQWFNYYVQKVIMPYPRIVPLLKELKTGDATDTAKADKE